MISNHHAFTLIELIVGVSISILLMVSVGVLTTNSIKHITLQKKILEENQASLALFESIDNTFFGDFSIRSLTSTSALIHHPRVPGRPHFTYLWMQSLTGYCLDDPTRALNFLTSEDLEPYGNGSDGSYTTVPNSHIILQSGVIVAGTWTTGNNFTEWIPALSAELSSPTGIVEIDGKAVFSDTGNGRILYLSWGNLYTLLNRDDRLNEPIGLKYDSGSKTLSILDAKTKKMFTYQSATSWFSSSGTMAFSGISMTQLQSIELTVINWSSYANISSPTATGALVFGGISTFSWDTISTGTKLKYQFASPQDLTASSNYSLTVNNLSASTGSTGNYFITLTLSGTTQKELYFPYGTKSDGSIFTKDDNTLTSFSLLDTPMSWSTTGSIINEPNIVLPSSLPKYASSFPIKDFQISQSGSLISLKLTYYEYYSCSDETEHRMKTSLWKFLAK